MTEKPILDLAAIRAKLAESKGKTYWRSLEELSETHEFQELLTRDYPRLATLAGVLSRRQFLKLMAASMALAGLTACSTEAKKIVPYVKQPNDSIPGKPVFYATAMNGIGVLVESHEGRPTKIEGNPKHPASLGATDAFTQAAILSLYDPERASQIQHQGQASTWEAFIAQLNTALTAQKSKDGAGLRILSQRINSQTLIQQQHELLQRYPEAKWIIYDPIDADNRQAGAVLAFGEAVTPQYWFDKADVILSLDADFLRDPEAGVRYAHDFTSRRRVRRNEIAMNRLYVIESSPTITGSVADHRLAQRASQIEGFVRALAIRLGITVQPGLIPHSISDQWLNAVIRDLQAHQGTSTVIAGDAQPPIVHALVYAINAQLKNVNNTLIYTDTPIQTSGNLRDLVEEMTAKTVEALIIIDGNPVYNAPVDLNFTAALANVKFRARLSLTEDETSTLCDWYIPETHTLEAWSDVHAYDGTTTIVQPLILPLHGGKSVHELLAALLGSSNASSHDIVQGYWKQQNKATDFDTAWKQALHDGVVANSAFPPKSVNLKTGFDAPPLSGDTSTLEVIFQPDPTIWDGQFANNGWLQELPKSLTQLTWDNAALLSPVTAQRLSLNNEDVIELDYKGRKLKAPVWILPGHPDEAITLPLGYGRTQAGKIGSNLGFNAYALRTSDSLWFDLGLKITKTGDTYPLASVHDHYTMEGRDIIHSTTPDHLTDTESESKSPSSAKSLYPPVAMQGQQWGMSIDLTTCIGCNACVIACQAENNIPIVGKEEVQREREMHWLRVDRYYSGDLDAPTTNFQPVPCMQCEDAPCEMVCPVAATVHSSDGLNDMVYNRCVGTRYCSNNCPYKVRRFNFFQYADYGDSTLKLLNNPNVTVRERGVMEKCTYCVQRIRAVTIDAEKAGRAVQDGEIKTACQQVCPAQAITFGNINDPTSQVSILKSQPHNYALLAELNTHPRTTYLASVRNPNPEIG